MERAKARLKNSITRYESVTGIEPKVHCSSAGVCADYEGPPPVETDRRNERRYRVYTTGLLADWHSAPTSIRIYFLAVVTNDWQLSMADVGLPITPARKSSDSRRNAYTGTRRNVVLSFIQRASIPASTIHYRPWNALHGPPFSTPDVALTLLNNLDMFTTL